MPYIHYSGLGAKESEIHTVDEFLHIMKSEESLKHYFEMSHFGIDMGYKNYNLPYDFLRFTLEDWIDYSGAIYYESNWDF